VPHHPHAPDTTSRTARPRTLLMCRPTYFDVCYSINPWMDPGVPTFPSTAAAQWKHLHDLLVELGHEVRLIQPVPGLPDMVFAANGALVVDGRVLVARFRHAQRQGESPAYEEWFRREGWSDVRTARHVNEGAGDLAWTGDEILAGTGFRTAPEAHAEVAAVFGRPVVSLTLVDPRFYHLDTALTVLARGEIMYYPQAFDDAGRRLLAQRYPDAVLASAADADAFGLNAFSDGRHVVLPHGATGLAAQLRERGYVPIGVELGELLKAGGGPRCCLLDLDRDPAREPLRSRERDLDRETVGSEA